jgi:hypothetical protein
VVVAKEPKGDTHYRFVSGEVATVAGDDVHAGTSVRGELRAERLQLIGRDPDHRLEELLLTDSALVRARIDLPGEVLAERADGRKLPLRDRAGEGPEAAGVQRREIARRDSGRRVLGRAGRPAKRRRSECERAPGGDEQQCYTELLDGDGLPRPPRGAGAVAAPRLVSRARGFDPSSALPRPPVPATSPATGRSGCTARRLEGQRSPSDGRRRRQGLIAATET